MGLCDGRTETRFTTEITEAHREEPMRSSLILRALCGESLIASSLFTTGITENHRGLPMRSSVILCALCGEIRISQYPIETDHAHQGSACSQPSHARFL